MQTVSLKEYKRPKNLRGNIFRAVLWELCSIILLRNPLCVSSPFKLFILLAFGAKLGKGIGIKPSVHIKYPWKLSIGADSWIGEGVWIDNIVSVENNIDITENNIVLTNINIVFRGV